MAPFSLREKGGDEGKVFLQNPTVRLSPWFLPSIFAWCRRCSVSRGNDNQTIDRSRVVTVYGT